MDEKVINRMNMVALLAKSDHIYYAMLKDLRQIEKRYDNVLGLLSPDQQDVICEFVSQCEAMNRRMLELACTYMRFPE